VKKASAGARARQDKLVIAGVENLTSQRCRSLFALSERVAAESQMKKVYAENEKLLIETSIVPCV
jgi:hypothetical protein